MDKIKQMFGNSPLEQRSEDAEKVKELKREIDQLVTDADSQWKLRNDILDIQNENNLGNLSPENRKYAQSSYSAMDRQQVLYDAMTQFEQLQKKKETLRSGLNAILDTYKEDPSVTGPKKADMEKELEFLKGKLERINLHLEVLNRGARDEFLAKGAVLENGESNSDYYAVRKEINEFNEEKEMTNAGISLHGEQADWKEGDLEAQNSDYLETVELTDILEKEIAHLSDILDQQKAFIKYVQDNKLIVDFKQLVNILSSFENGFVVQAGKLQEISSNLHSQGVRIKSEDLKPYLRKNME